MYFALKNKLSFRVSQTNPFVLKRLNGYDLIYFGCYC